LLDLLVGCARFVEYGAAMILFGSSLFFVYGQPFAPNIAAGKLQWTKHLLLAGAIGLLLATVTGFVAQTAILAGSLGAVGEYATLKAALFGMNFGLSSSIRLATALLAILASGFLGAGPRLWRLSMILGAVACASFAWMGHGAATQGGGWLIHLAGDISHSLAAAGWIGTLVVFCIMLTRPINSGEDQKTLCLSLAGFSGLGSLLVALILVSGLINSYFLVGWNPAQIVAMRYGQVLGVKLVLFVVMLGLAAANRFRHTPAFAIALQSNSSTNFELQRLRRSVFLETLAAACVLGFVSWLGMLPPIEGP
jgi:putative copper resistance protein D